MSKSKFWTPKRIMETCPKAKYFVVFGERSNGKTFGVKELALDEYLESGKQLAYVRRYEEDFKKAKTFYADFTNNPTRGNVIEKKTHGKYDGVKFIGGAWYLCKFSNDPKEKDVVDVKPFAISFVLSLEERYKSNPFPDVGIIFFDEFMTRAFYLTDEFILFTSLISTIVRLRDDVKVFMCANTISTYCPHLADMGIRNIGKMQDGQIDIYEYGDSGLKVAVERTEALEKRAKKKSNVYFAFSNPKLRMNTSGAFEVSIYPHRPMKFGKTDIKYIYFISFNGETFQCEIVYKEKLWFTFIHRKTTPIKEGEQGLIYQEEIRPERNYSRNIMKPANALQKRIALFFVREKVFYQDNEVGESIHHYLNWCSQL